MGHQGERRSGGSSDRTRGTPELHLRRLAAVAALALATAALFLACLRRVRAVAARPEEAARTAGLDALDLAATALLNKERGPIEALDAEGWSALRSRIEGRRALAEARFKAALVLDPSDPSARLGLMVAGLERRGAADPGFYGLAFSGDRLDRFCLPTVLSRLRAAGADPRPLDRLLRLYARNPYLFGGCSPAGRAPRVIDGRGFGMAGLRLRYRSPTNPWRVSFRMPLWSLAYELLDYHDPRGLCRAGLAVVGLAMVAATVLLAAPSPLAAAAACVLVWRTGALSFATAEHAYSLLVLAVAAALAWRERRGGLGSAALLACAVGSSLLCRSPLVFLPPLLFLRECRRPAPWRERLVILLAPYLVLLPWVWMNAVVWGRFMPLELGGAWHNAITAALGLVQGAEGQLEFLAPWGEAQNAGGIMRWAIRHILSNPWVFIAGGLKRAAFALALHPALAAGAALGIVLRRRDPSAVAIGALGLYFAAIHCAFAIVERYLWPLLPLGCVLGSLALPATGSWPSLRRAAIGAVTLWTAFAALASVGSLAYVSRFAWAARDPRRMAAEFERRVDRRPGDPWLRLDRAEGRLHEGRWEGAEEDFAAVVRLGVDASLMLAWVRHLRGSSGDLMAWRPRGPVDFDAIRERTYSHMFRAHAFLRGGRRGAAREELRRALELRRVAVGVRGDGPAERAALPRLRDPEALSIDLMYALRDAPASDRLAILGEFVALAPTSLGLRLRACRLALEAGKPELLPHWLAGPDWDRAEPLQHDEARSYLMLGRWETPS